MKRISQLGLISSITQYQSILSLIIVILVASWSLPVMARPPSPGDKDDNARRHDSKNISRSSPQNKQPERSSHRDIASPSNSPPTRSIASPQPSIIRSPKASEGMKTIQSHRDSSPSPVGQFRSTITSPRSETLRSNDGIPPAPSFNSRRSTGTPITVQSPAIQRFAPKAPVIQPRILAVGSDDSTTKRKFDAPKVGIAPDVKSNTRSIDNSANRAGRQEFQQRARGKIQETNPINTGQLNQNLRSGGGTRGQTIMSAPGGTDNPATEKNINLRQNLRSGSNPSMSEIRGRLNEQGRGKGNLLGDKSDKNQIILPKINTAPGGGSTITSGNPPDGVTTENVKQRLGAGDLRGKRGPLDLNLNKNIDTLPSGNPPGAATTDNVKQRLGAGDLRGKRGPLDLNLNKNIETTPLRLKGDQFGTGLSTKEPLHKPPQIGDMKINRDDMLKARFSDRLKSGELEKVAKGDIAQKVRLSDQFHMMQQGDVARRLDLQKHANNFGDAKNIHVNNVHQLYNVNKLMKVNDFYAARPYYYHGPVGPAYVNHCFKFAYFGPTFFAGACWYPHWNPWVAWSWNYHCHPVWDPRPIWCRPVVYDPYYDWAYWQTPVWVTLPVVQSGTWVDVERPVIPAAQYDLQLLAVRFVDPGHPEEKLGPRYRVWFRNNSVEPITNPFNVMLFAGNDDKLSADLPRGGVRVNSIEAGDTQSIDIRLPMEVAAMWRDADGNPAPFQVLHALVDASRETDDVTPTNNGAQIARDEVLPIDPAAFEVDPSSLTPGGEMILAGEGLGPQPGQVLINVAGRELQTKVLGWYDLGVRINVPQVQLSEPTPAEVIVVRGDGAATNPIKITLLPGQAGPTLVPPPPAPALETP